MTERPLCPCPRCAGGKAAMTRKGDRWTCPARNREARQRYRDTLRGHITAMRTRNASALATAEADFARLIEARP